MVTPVTVNFWAHVRTRGGGSLLVDLSDKMSDEKNENREGDGAMSFDGFCWIR